MKRVVFMGTPSYATIILQSILKSSDFKLVSLITQPDKPVGRKQILTPPDTKKYLLEINSNIDIYQPNSLKDNSSIEYIKNLKPDFIVVAAYGQILPKEILNIAPCINLHASILPKYRGASPIQDSIASMDNYSGVTAMKMDIGLDTGDILGYSYIKIDDLTSVELFDQLANIASTLTIKILENYENIKQIKQIDCNSTYSKKIKKSDGLLQLNDSKDIYAKYRAYFSWPGVFLKSGIKLKSLSIKENKSINKAGKILEIYKDFIIIGCTKGSIKLFRVQPPSKKEMSVIDYIRGKRLKVGDYIS